MKVSAAGLDFIRSEEGLRLTSYIDFAGYLTIGIGHLIRDSEKASGIIRIGESEVKWKLGLSRAQALELLDQDADWAEDVINKLVKVELNQNQFDSLCSFVFNIGGPAFSKGSLVKRLNEGKYELVPSKMAAWVYADDKKSNVLIARRKREGKLWSTVP